MKSLEKLRDMLCYELDNVAESNQFSIGMLDSIDKLVHTIKNIDKIMDNESGYSMDGGYSRENSYRRDSMGRYARRYSRDGAEVKSKLEELMNEAGTEKEREAIHKAMTMLDNQ